MCIAILCVLGIAGWWPFRHPKNDVTWLQNQDGLEFGDHATVLSHGAVNLTGSQREEGHSIEIWLQPDSVKDSSTILAFYTPEDRFQFSLRQDLTDLELVESVPGRGRTRFLTDDVFHNDKPVFISITSGPPGTSIYKDGKLVKFSHQFRLSNRDSGGRLVIGDSPVRHDSWTGQMRGFAFYGAELSASQVFRHYRTWVESARPHLDGSERCVAIYFLDERAGRSFTATDRFRSLICTSLIDT